MKSVYTTCCLVAVLVLTGDVFRGAGAVQNDLSCYQCNVTTNAECTDQYLLPCPDVQAFDSCEVRVRKAANGQRWIQKRCALSPCHLGTTEEISLGIYCDTSAPTYDCVMCCQEDGCNTGGSARLLPSSLALTSLFPWVLTAWTRH